MTAGQVGVVVLAFAGGGSLGLSLVSRKLYGIGRELWGPRELDWPEWLGLLSILLPVMAVVAAVGAAVGYVYALVGGALPLWTLAVPSLAAFYVSHRLNLWIAAKRAERAEEARR